MKRQTDFHKLTNGMTIIGEPMEDVGSAAFSFLIPCGTSRIGDKFEGSGRVITEWITRGAGNMSSRELEDKLDGLGLHRSSAVGTYRMGFAGALEAECLAQVLEVYADIFLRPSLTEEQFELSRQLAISDLMGLDDNPRQKVMIKLRQKFYPAPLGYNSYGTLEKLHSLTSSETREVMERSFSISETIFSVAGKYDITANSEELERLFAAAPVKPIDHFKAAPPTMGYTHEHHDGAQVHIGLMTETVPVRHKDYFNAQVAVSVLSGGMSSRLFTEVREKRGLCYAIGANYNTLKDEAGICCYAGTTPEKAEETLQVTLDEFNKLREGVSQDELDRAKAGLKSSMIMRSESSMSRASSIGGDYNLLGKVRCLQEIKEAIEAVTREDVNKFLAENPFDDYCIVSIGPKDIPLAARI